MKTEIYFLSIAVAGIAGWQALYIPKPSAVAATVFCGLVAIIIAISYGRKK